MAINRILYILCALVSLMTAGCERVHEPWVESPSQLRQERARPEQAAVELRHRLFRVQTDR